jgi:GTP-binding protein EngB required for normal cell division
MSDISKIYDEIQQEINRVMLKLTEEKSSNKQVGTDISTATQSLMILNTNIQSEYEKLKASSEWKRFTIAFYGETNAGKSTLIEALRLYLKEPTKLAQQQRFKQIQHQSGLTQHEFDKLHQELMDYEKSIKEAQHQLDEMQKQHAELFFQAELEVKRLDELLQQIQRQQNRWQKIIAWFFSSPEKVQLVEAKKNLLHVQNKQNSEIQAAQTNLKILENKKQQIESKCKQLDQAAAELAEFADGKIIGDGRSDFTRNNTSFDFDINGQQFTIIDVPGIEGKESSVQEPIEEAVRKAHAVFYVTRAPRPPQTSEGDDGNKKGTLEKIKAHLNAQTEVWSIYNHPVTNPRQLVKGLLGDDTENGLAALEEKLKKELPEQYQQNLVISARPAYLALTDCVVPGSIDATEQRKFIEKLGSDEQILQLSGLQGFIDKLKTEIIGDYKAKIFRSNLNKARKVLEEALHKVGQILNTFENGEKQVNEEVCHTSSQIDVLLEQFSGNLDNAGNKVICKFEHDVQQEVYDDIANDISNDSFKLILKQSIESASAHLEKHLQAQIRQETAKFEEEIIRVLKRSHEHLNTILMMQNHNLQLGKLNISVNVDNGLKWGTLASGGIGLVTSAFLLASTPAGWTIAFVASAMLLISAVIGIYKAAWGFFDSDYKKSQQRKETEKVLRKAQNRLRTEIHTITANVAQEMKKQMQAVQDELHTPVKQYAAITTSLRQAYQGLITIYQNVYNHYRKQS